MGDLEALRKEYQDRAAFAVIYIQEAHPSDGWQVESNVRAGIEVPQPVMLEARLELAVTCRDRLGIAAPMYLDEMGNGASIQYGAWPERLFVVDATGAIVYHGGKGPYGFLPAELKGFLASWLR